MFNALLILLLAALNLSASIFDFCSPFSEKAKRAAALMENFDPIAEQAIKDYNVPGLAIGLVVDGHLVYAKGFGYRDLERKIPVSPDTLFPVGSFTKAFTAFTVGTLVDESLLHWDQLIVDILPEFRLYDQYTTQNLTIRDLLTHRSGLPRHDFMWYNSTMKPADVMRRLQYLEPSYALRERYQYNNLMYLPAGFVIEQVTQKSWETLVKERLLKPLQMNHTNFSIADMQKESDYAFPYMEKGNEIKKMKFLDVSLVGPSASLNSNVNDLAHWVQMQLNGGVYEERSLISQSTFQEMHTPQIIVPGVPEVDGFLLNAYGIGWGISSYRGQYFLSHDGVSVGFTSVIGLLPQKGIGIIVLANRNLTSLSRAISLQVIDRVLELPPIDWLKQGLDAITKSKESLKENKMKEDLLRKKGTVPSHALEDFVGEYEHPGYGVVSVKLVGDKLSATLNGITFLLDHWHYDVFVIAEESQETFISREGSKITFRSNVGGDINELIFPLELQAGDIVFSRKSEAVYSTIAYLRQFVGVYEIYGYSVEVVLRNHVLCAIIPGQPIYELVPSATENEFTVKSMTGYSVRFVLDRDGSVKEVLLVQPYGAFTAKLKK